jgi:GTP pyrophosphokinase
VTGWITRGRGVTIHRRECAKAMELDPERRVDVSWASSAKVELPVAMRVVTSDRPGILANVSSTFTSAGVNIAEANCRTSPDGTAVNVFQFTVGDVTKLKSLMRSIRGLDGVIDVERV